MNRTIKYIVLAFVALATLGLSGCNKQRVKKAERPDKLEIVSLDKIGGSLANGLKITLTVKNNSHFNVRISEAEAFLQLKDSKLGRLAIDGEVYLPRRATTQVEVPIRITVPNIWRATAVFKLLQEGKYTGFTVNYNATVNAGKMTFKIKDESVTLEEFIKEFKK